jgi:membrane-associated phospholipid phosphatase
LIRRGAGALRRSEWALCTYFLYIAVLCGWRSRGVPLASAVAIIIPLALVAVASADSRSTRPGWSRARDWIPAVLVLVAYRSIDWVPTMHGDREIEDVLIVWDRTLLGDWGLRAATECLGALVPAILELAYLILYAVLPLSIASFYLRHERDRLDDFLFPFLLGTLTAYALLPHFPVEGPRFAFTGQDLPKVETVFRRINVWILDHFDIQSSVFPSGHVAAAFSAAFAMHISAPGRRQIVVALLALAVLVWINTIYGRYHYAADGLAGLAVSAATIGGLLVYRTRATKTRSTRSP